MDEMDQNEELFRAWIGEKKQDEYYNKMKNGGFKWAAFFLSDLIMLTRKMFLETIILIILVCLINATYEILVVSNTIRIITNFAISLTIGFTYYYMYRWSISRKIKKYQRQGLTYEEQLEIARKKGGNKITGSVIAMFFIEMILMIVISLIIVMNLTIYEPNNGFNDLIGKWYDSEHDIYVVIDTDSSFELYTSDKTTLNIIGKYTVEKEDDQLGNKYTITTNNRTISGTFYNETYTTQYSVITDGQSEMLMMNTITYTMYNLIKI